MIHWTEIVREIVNLAKKSVESFYLDDSNTQFGKL